MQSPQIIQGPALITYGGQTFFSSGDITVAMERATFDITTGQHGRVDHRHKSHKLTVSLAAIGQTDIIEYALAHIQGRTPGELLIPGLGVPVSFTAEADDETITSAAHGLSNGDRIVILRKTGGAEWSTYTVYYVINSATNTFKISLTAGGSAEAISMDVTSGQFAEVNETALVIQPLDNSSGNSRIWTFPRAGLTGVGSMKFSGGAPLSTQLTFTALESDAVPGTYYTTAAYAAPDSGLLDDFSAAGIIAAGLKLVWATDPTTLASGDVVMTSMDGWSLNIEFPTKEHDRDGFGIKNISVGAANTNLTVTGEAAAIYDHNDVLVGESSWATLMGTIPRPGQPATRKMLYLKAIYDDAATGINAGADFIRIGAAEWTSLGGAWGAEANRSGAVTFKVIPTFVTGVRRLSDASHGSISALS